MQRFLCKVWAHVCVIYTFHYESGTIYHSLFNQRKQIMTLCLHFWSVINLKQGIAALRKMISYWTALQTSAGVFLFSFSFYCVCYFLSLSLSIHHNMKYFHRKHLFLLCSWAEKEVVFPSQSCTRTYIEHWQYMTLAANQWKIYHSAIYWQQSCLQFQHDHHTELN